MTDRLLSENPIFCISTANMTPIYICNAAPGSVLCTTQVFRPGQKQLTLPLLTAVTQGNSNEVKIIFHGENPLILVTFDDAPTFVIFYLHHTTVILGLYLSVSVFVFAFALLFALCVCLLPVRLFTVLWK